MLMSIEMVIIIFTNFMSFQDQHGTNANNDIFNDKNRRMNEGSLIARQLDYFGKSGYLATITSEAENDIINNKAVGNGWMGGIIYQMIKIQMLFK